MKKKILIVGGSGYIGTILTDHFLNSGYYVRTIDLFLYNNNHCILPFLGREGYEFMFGDFCDNDFLNKALDGITHVVLLAGLVGDPITKKYPEESLIINNKGTRNFIDKLNGNGIEHFNFCFYMF